MRNDGTKKIRIVKALTGFLSLILMVIAMIGINKVAYADETTSYDVVIYAHTEGLSDTVLKSQKGVTAGNLITVKIPMYRDTYKFSTITSANGYSAPAYSYFEESDDSQYTYYVFRMPSHTVELNAVYVDSGSGYTFYLYDVTNGTSAVIEGVDPEETEYKLPASGISTVVYVDAMSGESGTLTSDDVLGRYYYVPVTGNFMKMYAYKASSEDTYKLYTINTNGEYVLKGEFTEGDNFTISGTLENDQYIEESSFEFIKVSDQSAVDISTISVGIYNYLKSGVNQYNFYGIMPGFDIALKSITPTLEAPSTIGHIDLTTLAESVSSFGIINYLGKDSSGNDVEIYVDAQDIQDNRTAILTLQEELADYRIFKVVLSSGEYQFLNNDDTEVTWADFSEYKTSWSKGCGYFFITGTDISTAIRIAE